jgi:hypothetical protein
MLGGGIVEHDMGGCPGCCGGEGAAERIRFGGEIRASDGSVVTFGVGPRQPGEPLFVGAAIVVSEGEDFTGRLFGPVVSSGGKAAGLKMKDTDVFYLVEEGGGAIGGAIVDYNDFKVGVVECTAG